MNLQSWITPLEIHVLRFGRRMQAVLQGSAKSKRG